MKFLFLFFLIFFFYSCGAVSNSCDDIDFDKIEKYKCETNQECIDDFNEDYVCLKQDFSSSGNTVYEVNTCTKVIVPEGNYCSVDVPEKQCVKDYCRLEPDICGLGECHLIYNNFMNGSYDCRCEKGTLYKIENNGVTCLENKCNDSEDCKGAMLVSVNTEDVYKRKLVLVCSDEGICTDRCIDDFDCKGAGELCLQNSQCVNLDKIECPHGLFVNPYKKRDNFNPGIDSYSDFFCGKNICRTNEDCDSGFTCGGYGKCVPFCSSDEDCLRDKFSDGNKCDRDLNYCVKK